MRKIFTEVDEDKNVLIIWEGESRRTSYGNELKANDNCYYLQINDSKLYKIGFKAVWILSWKLVNNCYYSVERKKREKQLEHILSLPDPEEWD